MAAALFAGFHSVAAIAAPVGVWRVIGRPAAHTLAEALRFMVPFGGVPLASLAIGQSTGPLIGVVRVGGAVLLTWVVFQVGFALAGPSPYVPRMADDGWAARVARSRTVPSRSPRWSRSCVLAAVAPTGSDADDSLRVAAVQGGGPQGTRGDRHRSA